MKVIIKNPVEPVYVTPGDTVTVSLEYEYELGGTIVRESVPVLREAVGRSMKIDEVAIFDLGEKELNVLGWSDGFAGAFGTRKT